MQCFLYSLHPREIRRQSSSTRCGSVKLLFLVPAPRGKPERQMKEMEHRSGTFFSGISVYASRISIADRGAAMNRGSWSSDESRIVEQQKQQHSSSGGGDVELLFLVPAPRGKPERQKKKMEHRSGTFLRDSLHIMHCGSALRIALRDASRIVEQQKQQHSSSSTAAAAQQQWWKRRRGYGRKGRA